MPKRIVFRADASTEIGLGHLMRCLTLADALRAKSGEIAFICRNHPGFLPRLVQDRGYKLHILASGTATEGPGNLAHGNWLGVSLFQEIAEVSALLEAGADWLVVDHYAIDKCWHHAMRPRVNGLLVIDDLADRAHDCDILLDQTLGRRAPDYAGLVPDAAHLLLGTRYALLRPGFAAGRKASLSGRQDRSRVKRLLIAMGGVDRLNLSARTLEVLADYSGATDFHVTVILGPSAPWRENVAALAAHAPFPVELVIDPPNIPTLLQQSDLAIGGGGGGAWERCAMGLPSVIIVMADNQINGARQLEAVGASVTIEAPADVARALPTILTKIARDGVLQSMSIAAATIVDGLGAPRVANVMEGGH